MQNLNYYILTGAKLKKKMKENTRGEVLSDEKPETENEFSSGIKRARNYPSGATRDRAMT